MSKTSKEDVLVTAPVEETVVEKTAEVLYGGADGDAIPTAAEEPGTEVSVDETIQANEDASSGVPDEDEAESPAAEKIQGRNLQTSTIVDVKGATIPSEDTSSFKVKSRFTVNGDITDPSKQGKSILADKMVNEAHQFQTSKSAVKPFPATGTEYLKTLDFKVNP